MLGTSKSFVVLKLEIDVPLIKKKKKKPLQSNFYLIQYEYSASQFNNSLMAFACVSFDL